MEFRRHISGGECIQHVRGEQRRQIDLCRSASERCRLVQIVAVGGGATVASDVSEGVSEGVGEGMWVREGIMAESTDSQGAS